MKIDKNAKPEFDWYSAGITDSPDYILARLLDFYGSEVDVVRAYPQNGYGEAAALKLGDRVLCKAMWGGTNTGDRVMVFGTGLNAPGLAEVVRREWPDHLLLRADVCIDVLDETAWDTLYSMGLNLGDKYGLKLKHIGDYARQVDGRTLEVGSKTSAVMARIYEKGIELRNKHGVDASTDLVRFEAEIKPKTKRGRERCAKLSPLELLGVSDMTTEVSRLLLGEQIPRVSGLNRVKRPSDRDRAIKAMATQYAKHLDSLREDLGEDGAAEFIYDLVNLALPRQETA